MPMFPLAAAMQITLANGFTHVDLKPASARVNIKYNGSEVEGFLAQFTGTKEGGVSVEGGVLVVPGSKAGNWIGVGCVVVSDSGEYSIEATPFSAVEGFGDFYGKARALTLRSLESGTCSAAMKSALTGSELSYKAKKVGSLRWDSEVGVMIIDPA